MIRILAAVTLVAPILVNAAVAAHGADELLAGVASVDITPEPGKMLWGYSNRTHAANRLGISVRTLQRKLRQYELERRVKPFPNDVLSEA